jgi:hypothetical protein
MESETREKVRQMTDERFNRFIEINKTLIELHGKAIKAHNEMIIALMRERFDTRIIVDKNTFYSTKSFVLINNETNILLKKGSERELINYCNNHGLTYFKE